MVAIATVGPKHSQAWQACRRYMPAADILTYPSIGKAITAFERREADFAVVPIYNTREGEVKDVRAIERLKRGYWIDNVVLPINLSLGALDRESRIRLILGSAAILKQCQEFIAETFPMASQVIVPDLDAAIDVLTRENQRDHAIVETEDVINSRGLTVRYRDLAPHNRTRFAVLGPEMTVSTGYDATAMCTTPLKDRVGLLYDMLGEFSGRGINILDMHTENDVKSQRMQIYLEIEGHVDDPPMDGLMERLEKDIIQEPRCLRILGSYPRVDMRTKHIKSFGFIGTGAMGRWFADRLAGEGYRTMICGRTTKLRPETMIPQVDVVAVCVPISATGPTVRRYGPLLGKGQALILLAGEAEETIDAALSATAPEVEVMLVHNLWGPKAATMKDKNAVVVRTERSGALCNEFEAFLYKHGAEIFHDSAARHDLLMGMSQKLPTAVSMAMAMALRDNDISPEDIAGHATLTSLYGILAMARVHAQNPRTYAEIMAAGGKGNGIVRDFFRNLQTVMELSGKGDIDGLCGVINQCRAFLSDDFLEARMEQALAVDRTLGRMIGGKGL